MAQNSDNQSLRSDDILKLAAEIVAAYVSNNPVPASELPAMIKSIHSTLGGLGGTSQGEMQTGQKPAVPVKRSVNADYIICLEDGKKFKSLKRHLSVHYGLTPDEYRAKWGLKSDYPMVAPNYAAQRSTVAKSSGLGRKPAVKPAKGNGKKRSR